MNKTAIYLFILLGLSSCIETVQLDLRSIEPQVVIEGKMTDDSTQNEVKITLSQDFQQKNEFPPITTAKVSITDITTGESEDLPQGFPGVYTIHNLKGVSGHRYAMKVEYNGKIYEAQSIMPQKVAFQELKYQTVSRFDAKTKMVAVYHDPKEEVNYYRWATISNDGIRSRTYFVRSDIFNNGNHIEQIIDSGIDINKGDKITIEMQCIDKATFDYFLTLVKQQGQGLNNGAAGTNPPSNISGGALGYFGAYTIEKKTTEIQ
jgi:hypothetical protein